LNNGTTYYVWIKAKNNIGVSDFSPPASGKPLGMPGTPTLSPAPGQLLVAWTAVAGADEYEVYYGINTPTTLAIVTAGTTATITGLTNGTTYYVRLRAKNVNGVSNYGASASGLPGLSPGLFRGSTKIGNLNLADSLTYISTNVVSGDNFYIILGADESASPKSLNYSNKIVSITLLGYGSERTITLNANESLFYIGSGVTLSLDENITLLGTSNNNQPLVSVNSNGKLVMNNGAKINNNISKTDGGGVIVRNNGIFTMSGGEISGNKSNSGGGVCIIGGTFTMSGGKISGNPRSGGSVYIISGGTFTMSGGEISSNSSDSFGGGVFLGDGTFTMSDGEISSNTSNSQGGGVYISNGIFTMSGGKISGNSSSSGGGIVNSSGTFTMSGGEILGNIGSYGGGVCILGNGTFTMSGGEISGNSSSSEGGGVRLSLGSGATFTKTGGTITGYASDMVNGNVVKYSSGVVQNNKGHAVYVGSSPSKRRETTAGETDDIDTTTGKGLSENGYPPFGE